jgi:hypothetical protein
LFSLGFLTIRLHALTFVEIPTKRNKDCWIARPALLEPFYVFLLLFLQGGNYFIIVSYSIMKEVWFGTNDSQKKISDGFVVGYFLGVVAGFFPFYTPPGMGSIVSL